MALFDVLVPMLRSRFPHLGLPVSAGERPKITIPASHADVGDIVLQDDGDEITAFVGHFTHSHFSNYDAIPTPKKEQTIAEEVVCFLERLFADRVVMWGSHSGGGGWRSIDDSDAPAEYPHEYVWSGPRNI